MPEPLTEPERPGTTAEKLLRASDEVLAACRLRFAGPDYEVASDDAGTVWVRRVDNRRSVGIQPWQLRNRSTDEIVSRVAAKLGVD